MLYMRVGDDREPVGDGCKRCFNLTQQLFGTMTWAQVCPEYDQGDKTKQIVDEAIATMEGKKVEFTPRNVEAWTEVFLDTKRRVQLKTERELKKDSARERLPLRPLGQIPCGNFPLEGSTELENIYIYIFLSNPRARTRTRTPMLC